MSPQLYEQSHTILQQQWGALAQNPCSDFEGESFFGILYKIEIEYRKSPLEPM